MELERFSAEASHLFSHIYGESTWFAWISAGSETRFIDSDQNRLLFQMAGFNEIQVLIAVPDEKSLFLPLTVSLLKEKLHDWQWRIQAGELIERQQQQINGLEQKLQTTVSSSNQRLTRLITQWK